MGVIEVDSDAPWPIADASDTDAAQPSEHVSPCDQVYVQGWENTMVESLLNEHRPGSSWMKKRKKKVQMHRPMGNRWSTMVQDWSPLNRPASVYWLSSDGSAQAKVYEILRPTLLISNQIESSMHCK